MADSGRGRGGFGRGRGGDRGRRGRGGRRGPRKDEEKEWYAFLRRVPARLGLTMAI